MGAAQTRVVATEEADAPVSHSASARSRRSIIVDEDDKAVTRVAEEDFAQTATETEGEEEEEDELNSQETGLRGSGEQQRLRRSQEPATMSERISRRRSQQRSGSGAEASCGYASSPSAVPRRGLRRGHADSLHRPSALRQQLGTPEHSDSDTIGRPARRKLAPLLVDTHHDLESPMTSPPPIIDKPREERSYREFYPDMITCLALPVVLSRDPSSVEDLTPSTLNADDVDRRLEAESLSSSPLSDISSVAAGSASAGERPPPSRASSSLSIKLIFNDPESPAARLTKPQSPLAGFGVPPLRSAGKSAQSYAGTPQSSVVVLAPKKPVISLPETRFKSVTDDEVLYKQIEFKRPESHYIRNVELTEKDLAERVEYDLEEVDREWLRSFNHERTVTGVGGPELSANVLEELIDSIEKTWFDLVKDVQKAISAIQQDQLPPEESACAICGEEECDNTNAIVFCDGCNLAVHQDCYGVPYIPEGQWLCRKCMLSPDTAVSCLLCPQRGGAFKKTTTNKWAHLLCALWIPEVGIANTVYMEPIDSLDQIPRSRWKLYCNLCHRKVGACIQCSQKQCVTAFHATCARRARLSMTVRADRRTGETVFRAFCERHTPPSHTQKIDLAAPLKGLLANRRKTGGGGGGGGTATPLALSLVSADLASLLASNGSSSRLSLAVDGAATPTNGLTAASGHWPGSAVNLLSHADKEVADLFWRAAAGEGGRGTAEDDASLQLTMRIFNPDHPVLNAHAFGQVLERAHLSRMSQQQRIRVVTRVGRFWALKRSVRHGAPLLKRLHLEPWTASVTKQRALEMAEEQRQGFIRRVRTDLERVRMLVESVRRRERDKLRRARVQVEYLQKVIDPVTPVMREIIDELMDKRDPRGIFSHPVSPDDAPDYELVVSEPMDFGTVRRNVAEFQYHRLSKDSGLAVLDLFERDVRLVCANCMAYNKPTTYYFQLAARILRHVDRLLADARKRVGGLPIDPRTGCLMAGIDFDIFSLNAKQPAPPSPPSPPSAAATTTTDDDDNLAASPIPSKDAEGGVVNPAIDTMVTPPLTRSQRRGDQLQQQPPLVSTTTTTTPPAVPPTTRTTTEKAAVSEPPRGKRQSIKNDNVKAFRRMTLFEQMSVPPPDVRKREISQYMSRHPGATSFVPHKGIPDDVNMLKDRLRRTSLAAPEPTAAAAAVIVSETPTKKRHMAANDDEDDALNKRSKTEQEEGEDGVSSPPPPADAIMRPNVLPTAAVLGESSDTYQTGTLVWVKRKGRPWFPSEVIRPNDRRVPAEVRSKMGGGGVGGRRNTLVWQFRGDRDQRQWVWVSSDEVCKMGVNSMTDEVFYRGKKERHQMEDIQCVRMAYREAFRKKKLKQIIATSSIN